MAAHYRHQKRAACITGMTDLELAFQMAKSGEVSGLTEIIHGLKREGRSANQIEGPALRRQLSNLIKAARG